MFQRCLTVALFLGCLLSVLSHNAFAFGPLNHACCVKYTVKPLPISMIKGYVMQSSQEVCRIDAIIFYTVRDRKVCASAKDAWVKTTLAHLSSRLKTLVANADGKSGSGEE
ncbi:hypothetical protein SKAU_G00198290 [Synaphobranchus kaupii]|uniref:Chemokine interleukin-8-like domain-containing protein n=1 Tax=Synaphobranchus kaupii TaxID=118154 RepID=A0A9Q1FFB4_SYNKA|nr:hypothetical protein SKAU_G00198290 [Synaphobranchus kaupii]